MTKFKKVTRQFVSKLQRKEVRSKAVKSMSYEDVIKRYEELCAR